MRIGLEHEYTPVDLDEDERSTLKQSKPRTSIWKLLLYLELGHVLLFALIWTTWHITHLDPYYRLHLPLEHNTTKVFTVNKEDLHLALNTDEANFYWLNITRDLRNGLVSLRNEWTKDLGLEGSGQNTTVGESVFQVDMFHQLHCLHRIRSDILAAPFLNQLNPNRTDTDRSTRHTLHCIDYLRQAVMCNGDMTLVSTGKDLEFDHSPPRVCRDFDAMSGWVMRNMWEFEKFTGLRSLGGPHAHHIGDEGGGED